MKTTIENTKLTDRQIHAHYDSITDYPRKSYANYSMYNSNYSKWAQAIEDLVGIKVKWIYTGRMVSFFIITEEDEFISVTSDEIQVPESMKNNHDLIFMLMSIFTRTCEMESDVIPNPYASCIYGSNGIEADVDAYKETYKRYVDEYAAVSLRSQLEGNDSLIKTHAHPGCETDTKAPVDDKNTEDQIKFHLNEAAKLLNSK